MSRRMRRLKYFLALSCVRKQKVKKKKIRAAESVALGAPTRRLITEASVIAAREVLKILACYHDEQRLRRFFSKKQKHCKTDVGEALARTTVNRQCCVC